MHVFNHGIRPKLVLGLTATIVVSMAAAAVPAEEPIDQCSIPHELVAPLLDIEPRTSECASSDPCAQELIATAKEFADQHPNIVLLHRSYQDLARGVGGDAYEEVLDRYRHWLEEQPDDPAALYLAARVDQSDPEKTRASLLRASDLDPKFPWAHLGLSVSYWRWAGHDFDGDTEPDPAAVEADRERAREHMSEFMRLCPNRFEEPLANAPNHFVTDYWRSHAERLRTALEQAPDRLRVAYSRSLWGLEFRITPMAEHEGVRARVATDLEAIEAMKLESLPTWWNTLEEGYRLTGNDERLAELMDQRTKDDPCSDSVAWSRMQRFMTLPDDPEEARALFSEVSSWSRECPDVYPYCTVEFELAKTIGVNDEQLLTLADRYLACWEANREHIRTPTTPYLNVARELLDRDLEAGRARELIGKDIAYSESAIQDPVPEGAPEELRAMMNMTRLTGGVTRSVLLARASLALGEIDAAAEATRTADEQLGEIGLLALDEDGPHQPMTVAFRGDIERLRGEIAEADERPLDAIGHYLEASRLESDDGDSADDALRVWLSAGGNESTFELVAAARSNEPELNIQQPSAWSEEDRELASFELTDLDGETWSDDRLRGSTTVINLWATWCAPCKLELPHLQKLHEALSDRDDARVVTWNLDRNLGLIAPFIAKHGYTFPVCLATDHVDATRGGIGIPQTWIVDGDGVIRFTQGGFSPDRGDDWVDDVLDRIDRLSGK